MDSLAGDGLDTFLDRIPMDFTPSPTSSSDNCFTVTSHPPLPRYKVGTGPSPASSASSVEFPDHSFRAAATYGFDALSFNETSLPRRPHHRRAHSETDFRLPHTIDDGRLDISEHVLCSDETSDNLFSSYLKMDNSIAFEASAPPSGSNLRSSLTDAPTDFSNTNGEIDIQRAAQKTSRPPRHRHSMSMDGSFSVTEDSFIGDLDTFETKKSWDPDQMAELSLMDPRRARRILANRQSAARSKERKLKYVADLEQRVQTLQKEATSLSAQLSMLQRDSKELSTENSELKLRLQSMEQQAQLRDALNETLKDEVRWLKSLTVHMNVGNGHALMMDTSVSSHMTPHPQNMWPGPQGQAIYDNGNSPWQQTVTPSNFPPSS